MRRVALKIAYIGSKFHGYQRQPNYRTVEGELLKAFFEAGVIEDTWKAHYSVAGRTDKGVHSTGNVISFITDETIRINYLNGLLPKDIKIIGEAKVPYGFKVRFPLSRTYTYIQPFNPFENNNWKILMLIKSGITEHLIKELRDLSKEKVKPAEDNTTFFVFSWIYILNTKDMVAVFIMTVSIFFFFPVCFVLWVQIRNRLFKTRKS